MSVGDLHWQLVEGVPPPGSDEALALGCRCPVLDNAHGAGVMGLGKAWWYAGDCEVHLQTWREEARRDR